MINIIDFQIISECNLSCKYCCDGLKWMKHSTLEGMKKVVDKIQELGIENICITGGEPLLYESICELLDYIHQKGIKIYLSTNGVLLEKKYSILRYVDTLGLPIDSMDRKVHEHTGRNLNQFEQNVHLIKKINRDYPTIKVKIGTVVTKYNIMQLSVLNKAFESQDLAIDVWRLYQFSPVGVGANHISEFQVTDSEFKDAVDSVKKQAQINISALSVEEAKNAYIFVTPNLELAIFRDNQFEFCGNIVTMDTPMIKQILQESSCVESKIEQNRKWLINE